MAQRLVRFSDLTNKVIDGDEVVRIVIEQHPALRNGPVELEAALDEVVEIRSSVLNVVSLKLYHGDGSVPETVTMETEAFNRLAGDMNMEDVLRKAQPAYPPRRPTKAASASIDKLDYASLEHAGKPHRGKTTDAEKEIVCNNLGKINERLERDGLRTIKLDDAEMVARYGLETLAKEAGHFLEQ
jgi:hypothetical protein